LKKAERTALPRFFYRHHNLVGKASFALYCVVESDFAVKVNRHQNISEFSSVKSRVFDRRAMDTDRPSQEGREDVPSDLSFISAPREADPMPAAGAGPSKVLCIRLIGVTRPSEGTRPELTPAMVTRSRARDGRGISVVPVAQIEPEIETRPEQEIATSEEGLGAARPFPTDGSWCTFAEIYRPHKSGSNRNHFSSSR